MELSCKKPFIYLPIEIKVREFDGKLLFALIAAENGFNVILGRQKDIRKHLYSLPQGLYIDKSAAITKVKWFNYFKKFGNLLAAWDEEGLIIHEDTYMNRRVSGKSYQMLEKFFAWGDVQAELIRNEYKHLQHKVIVAGNPRFDLLRPEVRGFYSENVNKLKEKFGPTILINTNFGFFNHVRGIDIGKKKFRKSVSSIDDSFIDGWVEFQQKTFKNFVAMLPVLSHNFPDHSIVVRPHPAENHEVWKNIAKKTDSVRVIHEGNVIEWLLAADVVIHSNCSTGVEAFLSDTPVIAFRPFISERFETYLPNIVSKQVFSIDELFAALKEILLSKNCNIPNEEKEQCFKVAEKYISALNGPLSSERIVQVIQTMNLTPQAFNLSFFQKISRLILNLLPSARTALNTVKNKYIIPQYQYAQQAHPSKTIAQIQDIIENQACSDISLGDLLTPVQKFQQVLNRFDSVRVENIKPNCFFISDS
jgi:surface carbohydrate biosynthesis protein